MHPHCKDGDDYSAAPAAVVKIAWKQCDQAWWGKLLTQKVSTCFISTSARLLVTNIVWDQKLTGSIRTSSSSNTHILQPGYDHKISTEIHTSYIAVAIIPVVIISWFLCILSSRSNQWLLRSSYRAVHRVHSSTLHNKGKMLLMTSSQSPKMVIFENYH